LFPYGFINKNPTGMCPDLDYGGDVTPEMAEYMTNWKGRYAYLYRLSVSGYANENAGIGKRLTRDKDINLGSNDIQPDMWLMFDSAHESSTGDVVRGTRGPGTMFASNLVVDEVSEDTRHKGINTTYFDGSVSKSSSGDYLDKTDYKIGG